MNNSDNKKQEHFDAGIVGWWYNLNYGGTLTYYALNQALKKLGFSVLMIQRSSPRSYSPNMNTVPRVFAEKHYSISEKYEYAELKKLNEICDSFIVGSDQLWNPYLWPFSGPEFFLSFVDKNRKKLSYATSFGNISSCEKSFIDNCKGWLNDFDKISVREDYAVDICQNDFNLEVSHVCDPVFLCDKENYNSIAESSEQKFPQKYVLNFLLDPNKDKISSCRYVREKLGINDAVNFTDLQDVEKRVSKFDGEKVYANASIEDFLCAYKNADFVVTDSFHGTCFAIIFNKPFISLANMQRGEKRFISLLKWLKLTNRLVFDLNDIQKNNELLQPIDYSAANKIIDEGKAFGLNWLKTAIDEKKVIKKSPTELQIEQETAKLYSNPDFIKIRLLATLLRDYGVKHIVLSPGGRDVPIVRMFEYNEGSFILHRVTDERSAAYFALGIAAQLKQPVACVCTSGTAASNYLPAITEAYYTGVPLIAITADRRQIFLNQGEDQTIPQKHIYRDVIKKEITVPEGSGYQVEHQTIRDISDCILETTHNGFGPVHINIAIDNISIGSKLPKEKWALLPRTPHLLRVQSDDDESQIMKWVNSLKASNRILVVYGQNPPPTDKQKKYIEEFASKFNCVIVTDFISNLDCAYSLKPYNMLSSISQQEFNEKLSPDILISIGGKRLMNDPLTFKVRGGDRHIRHWSVTPDGKVKDFYFRLTSIVECSQDFFFKWFSEHSGNIINDGVYYSKWKELTEKYHAPQIDKFNSHYVQSKFIPSIPPNSILHLGVGQSFYDCRRYEMNPNVDVFCNMGTNGIDGCTSTFMGQCSVVNDKLCFLLVGDLSFFYDMNSIWNKNPQKNIRILMVNNNGTDLLRGHGLKAISAVHNTKAKGWVESTGFEYLSAENAQEYDEKLQYFLSNESQQPLFFEVFCD